MNLKETFFPKIFIFAAVLCFLCGTATAQTVTIAKTFTESSSWEIPAGVTSVTIECVGGGGAGGYVHGEGQLFRNSGGGGGGSSKDYSASTTADAYAAARKVYNSVCNSSMSDVK